MTIESREVADKPLINPPVAIHFDGNAPRTVAAASLRALLYCSPTNVGSSISLRSIPTASSSENAAKHYRQAALGKAE